MNVRERASRRAHRLSTATTSHHMCGLPGQALAKPWPSLGHAPPGTFLGASLPQFAQPDTTSSNTLARRRGPSSPALANCSRPPSGRRPQSRRAKLDEEETAGGSSGKRSRRRYGRKRLPDIHVVRKPAPLCPYPTDIVARPSLPDHPVHHDDTVRNGAIRGVRRARPHRSRPFRA